MTTKSKRVTAVTACLGAAMLLTACGAGGGGSNGMSITYLPGVAGDAFYVSVGCAAKTEAKQLGVNLNIQAPQKFDVTLQRPIFDAAVAQSPKALIVTPDDESALQEGLAQAKRNGIKIVLSDTTTKDPSVAESSVTSDNVKIGELAFQAVAEAHPEGGKVLVIGSSPGISTNDDRVKGFEQAAKADPKFTYVGVQYAKDDNAQAANLTSAALQKSPDIIGIFGVSGNESQGAATAVRAAGLKGKLAVVGVDAYPAEVAALQSGDIQALVTQDVAELGKQSVLQAYNAVAGKPVTKDVRVVSKILTAKTLATPQGQAEVYQSQC